MDPKQHNHGNQCDIHNQSSIATPSNPIEPPRTMHMRHICFGVDKSYATLLPTLVLSLALNSNERLTFWVATSTELPLAHIQQIIAAGQPHRTNIINTTAPSLPANPRAPRHLSDGMYLRLALPSALPKDVTQYLYLDADILCTSTRWLQVFSYQNAAPISAVADQFTPTWGSGGGIPNVQGADNHPYFNSGVLLVNREEWERRDLTQRALQYLTASPENRGRFPDQDALNVAAPDWSPLPRHLNYMRVRDFNYIGYVDPTRASLLHFAGPNKPWQVRRQHSPVEEHYRLAAKRASLLPQHL
ncbi:glycosyltransferase family 8 protein [Luteococcus sanguinis]|uniref:Glycosyltransferase family 8 protein n=1 Tax=Luteococcus sanguinis TaxID=174038 RepID=A0ABW1X1G3_9ACTN